MRGQFTDALHVVATAHGRLRDDYNQIRARDRRNDGTADAGGTVNENQIAIPLLGHCPGLFANGAHQFAGVLFGDAESGMDQRAEPGLGNIPLAVDRRFHLDGPVVAEPGADPTSLARDGIHPKRHGNLPVAWPIVGDGVKPAQLFAFPAGGAVSRQNAGDAAPAEGFTPLNVGAKNDVQVGRIHVTIGQHRVASQGGKRGDERGLAGAAFSADDDDFFHESALPDSWCVPANLWTSCQSLENRSRNSGSSCAGSPPLE